MFDHDVLKPSQPAGARVRRPLLGAAFPPHRPCTPSDIEADPRLEIIAQSDEAGVYIAKSTDSRHFFVFGHPEYDADTLRAEYERDVNKGMDVPVPAHYFPNDDPAQEPVSTWRAHAQLLYTNWLNYYVYQTTPYDLNSLGTGE